MENLAAHVRSGQTSTIGWMMEIGATFLCIKVENLFPNKYKAIQSEMYNEGKESAGFLSQTVRENRGTPHVNYLSTTNVQITL